MVKPRAYLDTNVFIHGYEELGQRSEWARELLTAVERRDILAVASELVLSELLVKPLELGDEGLAKGYKAIFSSSSGFEIFAVERSILVSAAELRAARRALRLADAIHVATALASGCRYFISGETRMPIPEGLLHLPIASSTLTNMLSAAP